MIKNKNIIIAAVCLSAVFLLFIRLTSSGKKSGSARTEIINPAIDDISLTVATTGIIKPQNRLEIKPSISGRIEKIMVKEGDKVESGSILAWMSSSERAALVDAARSQGNETVEYWEEVYKKTPIISPIDGEVIVRSVEPGQTITTSDNILVLSDRLVVSAQFDETDIGRIKIGQKALITLDAYPDVKLQGLVDHVAYESEILNNVTIYNVDILPKETPELLRSGMSVSVEVTEKTSAGVITIPSTALHYDGGRKFVLVQEGRGKITERNVTVGLNNDKTAEIVSGLTTEDKVVMKDNAYLPKKKSSGTNPFMPDRNKNKK